MTRNWFLLFAILLPFYGGPLLAGWAAHPQATIPVFAALFLGFLLGTGRDLHSPGALVAAGVIQLALAAAVYWLGFGLALVLGTLLLPLWLPLLLTLAATLFGIWRLRGWAKRAARMEAALTDAAQRIDAAEKRRDRGDGD